MEIRIEKAQIRNISEIKKFLADSWRKTYRDILPEKIIQRAIDVWQRTERLTVQITGPGTYFPVARNNKGKIIALMTVRQENKNEITVSRLYVDASYQGKGIGTELLNKLPSQFPKIKKIRLQVDRENRKARKFYAKRGFKESGTEEKMILDYPRQLIIMEKTL